MNRSIRQQEDILSPGSPICTQFNRVANNDEAFDDLGPSESADRSPR